MPVELRNESELPADEARLRRAAQRVLEAEGRPRADLFVLIVGDRRMLELNRTHLGRDGTTDVIAFALSEAPGPAGVPESLGDVVVSAERAAQQADELGEDRARELTRLVIHGVLHLLGWDDVDPDDRAAMHERTEQLLLEVEPK